MDEMNAFESQVAGEVAAEMGPHRPVDSAAIFVTAATTSPRRRIQPVFSATRFVVAGAIVALFGSLLLAGVLTRPSDESASIVGASASPVASSLPAFELPAEIPAGIDSGTLDTPLGPARWVRLTGDHETLPRLLRPVPVPGGYVSLDLSADFSQGDPNRLWFSADLLDWSPRALPATAGAPGLMPSGGAYWLKSAGQLWRSADGLTWETVDISGLAPHLSTDIDWRLEFGEPASSNDVTVVPVRYEMQDTRDFFGLPPLETRFSEPSGLVRTEDGHYSLVGDDGDILERVRFEETGAGLRITDAATGDLLAEREGLDVDAIDRLADVHPIGEYRLAIVEGGSVRMVDLPRPEVRTEPVWLHVISIDEGFRAFQRRSDSLIQTWTSPDGIDWALDEVLGDDPGEPNGASDVEGPLSGDDWRDPDLVVAWTDHTGWVSRDGLEWQVVPRGPSFLGDEPPGFRYGPDWTVTLIGDTFAFYPVGAGERFVVDLPEEMLGRVGDWPYFHPVSANAIAVSFAAPGSLGARAHTIITFDGYPAQGGG